MTGISLLAGSLWIGRTSYADQLPRNPVSAFIFDEGSGTTTTELNGPISGTLEGPATFSTTTPFNYANNFALDLSSLGTNDYVDLGDQEKLFFPGSFSISTWVRPTDLLQNAFGTYIVADYASTADLSSFAIRLEGTNNFAPGTASFFWENPQQFLLDTQSLTDLDDALDLWYHIVSVFEDTDGDLGDEGMSFLYVNGSLESSNFLFQTRADVGGSTAIGRAGSFDNAAFNFDGQIDEVAFFDYALNDQEVLWLNHNSLKNIPEPGSAALLAAAGSLIGAIRRRREASE